MAAYKTIHTNYGLGRIAAAEASGIPINLTHMAVGDGAGSATVPDPAQTALVNERYRATINRIQVDPTDASRVEIEMLINAATGGWTIREFGIFDDDGNLFAVGNFPATYKTVPSDGASNDMIIRAQLVVANVSVITLIVDPSVVIASRAWVLATVTGAYLIPGGTTGQVLTKQSNADGDYDWETPGSQVVLVTTLEEAQTVTANPQLTFNLVERTTVGLSVLVEGVRIPKRAGAGGWQQGASTTQVILGTQYPIGTELTFLQNEPVGNLAPPLARSLNLSDVADVPTARENLGVYSKTDSDKLQPAGNIAYTARATPPSGWVAANGAALSRATYSALFTAIGTTYGSGDGSTTFNVPDLRGEFIRGLDSGRGIDVGRALGSVQAAFTPPIPRDGWGTTGGGPPGTLTPGRLVVGSGFAEISETLESLRCAGGDIALAGDTRPRNIALLPIIKF